MSDRKLIKEEKKLQRLNRKNEKIENKRIKDINNNIKKEKNEEIKAPIREKYRALNEAPKRSVLEEIGNSVTHGVGAILAIVAFVLMIRKSDTPQKIVSACVYGFCMFFMMLMSCLYHAFKYGSTVKRIWRRFDYTSIYLLIGGTFAPILLVFWGNPDYQMLLSPNFGIDNFYQILGIVVFIVQWVVIITGITLVCIFGPGRIKFINFPLYFTIGWAGILFIPGFFQTNNYELFYYILGGGIIYTLGMIPFAALNKKEGAHFLWHFFVLAGAIVQYLGILFYIF